MVIQLDELRMVIATRTSQKTATATIFNLRTSTRNSHFFLHVSSYSNPQKDAELREILEVKYWCAMGKATAGRPFVARVLLPEGREVEFSLDHGPFLGKSPISWLDLLGSKGIIKRFPPDATWFDSHG